MSYLHKLIFDTAPDSTDKIHFNVCVRISLFYDWVIFDVQDELEKLRHSAQMEKNNLTASLASIEEQNRHLKSKLQVRMRCDNLGIKQASKQTIN